MKGTTRAPAQPGERREQERLELEFDMLKQSLGLDDGLELRWLPAASRANLSGEVKGRTVFIYPLIGFGLAIIAYAL